MPVGTFADVDAGDTLVLSATGLPGWLAFDAASGTFSGTPANGDVGSVSVTLTATDAAGVAVSQAIAFTVTNVNDAPTVAVELADKVAAGCGVQLCGAGWHLCRCRCGRYAGSVGHWPAGLAGV